MWQEVATTFQLTYLNPHVRGTGHFLFHFISAFISIGREIRIGQNISYERIDKMDKMAKELQLYLTWWRQFKSLTRVRISALPLSHW